jgi:hypothetical protein
LPEHLGKDVVSTAKTPDGRLLILAMARGPVWVVAGDTYKDVAVLDQVKAMLDLAVSADGRFLACYGIFTPHSVWDLSTHELHRRFGDDTTWVGSAAVDEGRSAGDVGPRRVAQRLGSGGGQGFVAAGRGTRGRGR